MPKTKLSKNFQLNLYAFYWSNTRIGITDAKGTTHYVPDKRIVVATTPKEARAILNKSEKRFKDGMRAQLKNRSKGEVEKLINRVCYKDGLCMREFLLRKGLII